MLRATASAHARVLLSVLLLLLMRLVISPQTSTGPFFPRISPTDMDARRLYFKDLSGNIVEFLTENVLISESTKHGGCEVKLTGANRRLTALALAAAGGL